MMDPNGLALNAKTKKFRGETSEENNVDRLGNLPEELIGHIMSFLPMEDAVRTDALSQRWKYRWTNISDLTFHDYCLRQRKKTKKANFMTFIERVLILLGNQVIKSFSLECLKEYDAARVHTWITAVVRRKIEKLKIYCSIDGSLVFPIGVFDRKSLTEMQFIVPCTFKIPTFFSFSSMKVLHLCQVNFSSMGFPHSRELNISFPLLKELSLWGCTWENVLRINIDAPVLQSFSIGDFEYYFEHKLGQVVGRVRKDTTFSEFEGGTLSYEYIALVSPSSVTDASIELSTNYLKCEHSMGALPCSLLRQFCSLKSLTLSRDTIRVLPLLWLDEDKLPRLGSILQMTISGGTPAHCKALINLLQHLPCLESLTICQGNPLSEEDRLCGIYEECPLPCLKIVEFSDIAGRDDEIELAKFLLQNAKCLEELTIIARGTRKIRERKTKAAREELLNFPRASPHASVKIL